MLAKVHWRGIDDLLCCSLPLSRTRRPTLHFAGTGPTTRSLNDYAVQEVAIESKRVPVQRRFSAPRICTTAEARSAAITQSTRTGNPTGRGDSVRRQIPQRHLRCDRKRVGPKGSADSRLVNSASPGPNRTTASFQLALTSSAHFSLRQVNVKGFASRPNGSDLLCFASVSCSPLPKCGPTLDLLSPSLHLASIELMLLVFNAQDSLEDFR